MCDKFHYLWVTVSFIIYNNNNIGWLYFGLYENILHSLRRHIPLAIARGICVLNLSHPILYKYFQSAILLMYWLDPNDTLRESFFFWIVPFIVYYKNECMVILYIGEWTSYQCSRQVISVLCTTLFQCVFGLFIPIFKGVPMDPNSEKFFSEWILRWNAYHL